MNSPLEDRPQTPHPGPPAESLGSAEVLYAVALIRTGRTYALDCEL